MVLVNEGLLIKGPRARGTAHRILMLLEIQSKFFENNYLDQLQNGLLKYGMFEFAYNTPYLPT